MLAALIIYAVVVTILGAALFAHLITSVDDAKLMQEPRVVRIIVTCLWPIVMAVWAWDMAPKLVRDWLLVVAGFCALLAYGWSDLVEWLL